MKKTHIISIIVFLLICLFISSADVKEIQEYEEVEIECDLINVTIGEEIIRNHEICETCYYNKTTKQDECYNKYCNRTEENITIWEMQCEPLSTKIKFKDEEWEFELEGLECDVYGCDKWCDKFVDGKCVDFADGNGDAICQSGESNCLELQYADDDIVKVQK